MSVTRVLSLSTLFPSPSRPAFGAFVAAQMDTVAARGDVDLTMVNPVGLPPWPLTLRQPYRTIAQAAPQSHRGPLLVHHPKFRLFPLVGGDSNPRRIARAVLPLVRQLHAERSFDVVDAQFFFPDGPAAAEIARALGLPLTIKARGSDIHLWGQRPVALAQMRAAAHQAARMLAVSEALKRDMAAHGLPGERTEVHYTGLDHRRFRPVDRPAVRRQLTSTLGLPADGPLLVIPAALIAIKSQALAIEAVVTIPGAHLAIAGTGPDRARLVALATKLGLAERVHFLGQVSPDHIPRLLAAANVVVMPSQREGLANAWVESLACGTPLVIPDVGGAREVIRDQSAGRIVEREPSAIASAVREILLTPPGQDAVAANVAQFTWEANAAVLADVWRKAAAQPVGAR